MQPKMAIVVRHGIDEHEVHKLWWNTLYKEKCNSIEGA
jgi:hypothetical protein